MEDSVARAFYGFAIPAIWKASGHHPFIIDTGRACDDAVSDQDEGLASACYQGQLYKLADPVGESHPCSYNCGIPGGCKCNDTPFSSLAGTEELDGSTWGDVAVEDVIIGFVNSLFFLRDANNLLHRSVKTFLANGKENTNAPADPTNPSTLTSLLKDDITTAGFITLPVCTRDRARTSWANADESGSGTDQPDYPCNINNGKDYCRDSTFEDQTSGASPLVSDCLQIVKNIQGTDGSWNTFIETQREIASFGKCKFGVTGKGRKGNSNFDVGAQDVVDIIHDAVDMFGNADGRVGAKGVMQCDGNLKDQKVEWGLY